MLFQIFYGIVIKKEKLEIKKQVKDLDLECLILMIKQQLQFQQDIIKTVVNVYFIEVKNKNPRKLTPREVFRLQGFPESFKFPVSDLQAYKQAGNAVAINVVEKNLLKCN